MGQGRHVSPCRRVADTIMGVMVGQGLMVRKARHWVPPIDQTSVRTKGKVIVFGLGRLWTKECTYRHNFSYSRWLLSGGYDGGGVRDEGEWE
jgi:hypothetical protein